MKSIEEMEPIVIELKPEKPATKKILLTGLEVHIAEEVKIFLTADGKTLTEAEYVEYSKEGVVKRVTTLGKPMRKLINVIFPRA